MVDMLCKELTEKPDMFMANETANGILIHHLIDLDINVYRDNNGIFVLFSNTHNEMEFDISHKISKQLHDTIDHFLLASKISGREKNMDGMIKKMEEAFKYDPSYEMIKKAEDEIKRRC